MLTYYGGLMDTNSSPRLSWLYHRMGGNIGVVHRVSGVSNPRVVSTHPQAYLRVESACPPAYLHVPSKTLDDRRLKRTKGS